MTWSNWVSYLTDVLGFFVTLFGQVVSLITTSPIIGVPVILGIIGLGLAVVTKFIGAFGAGKNKDES